MTTIRPHHGLRLAPMAAAVLMLTGCWGGSSNDEEINELPGYVVRSSVQTRGYDGNGDDLLTAGLGRTGLASATAPGFANASAPTAAELRRFAIYNNYRAIVDTSTGGGYGTLYGPNVDVNGNATASEGKIAGEETLAYSDDGSGRKNVTLMVQVPNSFSEANPCIVTATSSGSRGVYGAISVAEWGLKRGCAVAFTDKGTGAGPHDLQGDTVALIDGTRTAAATAGLDAHFNANLTDAERASFNATTPNRLAFKHAHSQQNPEKDWGNTTLMAVEFAFYVINQRYGRTAFDGTRHLRTFKPENTLVIASSLSNGGGAAIAAAEQDSQGWIDGIAVSEPAVELPSTLTVSVRRGATNVSTFGKHLYDHISFANLYQACATQAPAVAGAALRAVVPVQAAARCDQLAAQGLVSGATTAERATDALARLNAYGWDPESADAHAVQAFFQVAPAVTATYASAYSRSSAKDRLCGFSFAFTDATGAPTAVTQTALAQGFGNFNGVPPTGGVNLVNDNDPSGPKRDPISVSPSSGVADWNLDGARCLRDLLTGTDTKAVALRQGLDETRRNGNLKGKPAIIVHGRSDALLPANHHSRPYTALNKQVEGNSSQLSYIEVTNAQHFDAFNTVAGFDNRYVPLHVYLNRAMDAMWAKLKNGTALPPSQVVRTVPRGGTAGAAPAITAANVPAIAASPAAGDAITMSGTTLVIPD